MNALATLKLTAALSLVAGLCAATPVLAKGSLSQHTQCSDHPDSMLCPPPPGAPVPDRPWKKLHGADDPEMQTQSK